MIRPVEEFDIVRVVGQIRMIFNRLFVMSLDRLTVSALRRAPLKDVSSLLIGPFPRPERGASKGAEP